MNNAVNLLPKMLFGKELYDAITVLPEYDRTIGTLSDLNGKTMMN